MGRTVLHGRGEGTAGRRQQAVRRQPSGSAKAGGRGSGGRDHSNVPRLATLVRAIAALLALCLVVVAGVGVYAALGDLSAAARFGTERWDAPVSDDQTRQRSEEHTSEL